MEPLDLPGDVPLGLVDVPLGLVLHLDTKHMREDAKRAPELLGLLYQVAPTGLKVRQGPYLEFHKDVTPGLLVATWALQARGHWQEQARQWKRSFMHNTELTPARLPLAAEILDFLMAPPWMLSQEQQAARAGLESKEPQCLSDIRKAIPLAKDWARAMVLKAYEAWQTKQEQT